MAIAPGLPVTP